MPEKYGRPLIIITAILIIGILFLVKGNKQAYQSKYNNTLQHDINLVQKYK